MAKKVIALSCTVLLVLSLFTGCSSSVKDENNKLKAEVSTLKEKNSELEKKVSELTQETKTLNEKLNSEVDSATNDEAINKSNLYPIYTADVNTLKKEIGSWIYIAKDATLNQKLNTLAKALSEINFSSLPIEVKSIKTIDGKKIVEINLKESKENQNISDPSKFKGKSWETGYFQGSTGGSTTKTSLIETFLQREYKGQWIDGVKFLYNGKAIEDYEHVEGLSEVNYR